MPSPNSKPPKILAEFLKEQQDPFILDLYLLERGYSAKSLEKWAINKKRFSLFPFSKLVTSLRKKLLFHNHSCIVIRDSDIVHQHVDVVSVPQSHDQTIEDTDRFSFSTATSSTLYLSCSDIDEDGTSLSPHNHRSLFSANTCQASNIGLLQSQQATDNEKHLQRCLEGSPIPDSRNICVKDGTTNQDYVWGREERMGMRNWCVLVPKKMREESLLSTALWSSVMESAKREKCRKELRELKCKTLLHKAKQLLLYCAREISINVWRKDCGEECLKQLRGAEEVGKRRELGGKEINIITKLLSFDEWSEWKPQVTGICVDIVDAVLELLTEEIVTEMIQVL